jgi:membrane-associated progesterone receptor component
MSCFVGQQHTTRKRHGKTKQQNNKTTKQQNNKTTKQQTTQKGHTKRFFTPIMAKARILAPLLVLASASIVILNIIGIAFTKESINVFLMGFFRDLARIKANKRRNRQSSDAVVAIGVETVTTWDILMGRDDPMAGIDFSGEECDDTDADTDCIEGSASHPTFTASELQEFGSGMDERPIYLSVFGRVYDVSRGEKFYGPGASYSMFAGKDVTRALCLGCKAPECLVRSTEGLTEDQIEEGKRWLSFFHLHDKYNYIGSMERLDSEAWLDELIEDALAQRDSEENDETISTAAAA